MILNFSGFFADAEIASTVSNGLDEKYLLVISFMFQDEFVFFILILNIIFNTAGHISLKKSTAVGEGGTVDFWKLVTARPSFVIGLVCFIVEFALWLSFLSWLTLSEAMLIGMINTVCIVLAGRLFFGERITFPRLIGIILIIVGVGIVGMKNA